MRTVGTAHAGLSKGRKLHILYGAKTENWRNLSSSVARDGILYMLTDAGEKLLYSKLENRTVLRALQGRPGLLL